MKQIPKILTLAVFFALAVAVCAYAAEAENPSNLKVISDSGAVTTVVPINTTLDNLQTAYNGESNARAKYLAFAKQADKEGYKKAASLFRAAAHAEKIHLTRHGKIIRRMGSVAQAKIETPVVKSTAENLQAAFEGETYENTKMYPEFLAQAKIDKNEDAIDAFEDAGAAEGVHASLYKQALENLAAWKGKKTEFYVCPKCGNVVGKLDFKKCPICETGKIRFITVD